MSDDDIRESKETLLQDIEKILRFKDEQLHFGQQVCGVINITKMGFVVYSTNNRPRPWFCRIERQFSYVKLLILFTEESFCCF